MTRFSPERPRPDPVDVIGRRNPQEGFMAVTDEDMGGSS